MTPKRKKPSSLTEKLVVRLLKIGPVESHRLFKKVAINPACPVDYQVLATWYTPGVADPCRQIFKKPDQVWELTGRDNRLAVVSDGTRILGLRKEGVFGAEASLPVMEGKALLFRALGAVEAVPLVLGYRKKDGQIIIPTVQEIIKMALLSQANYGGINLEDIEVADDKCHRVLQGLRNHPDLEIPVWHDDQQGTATVILAGLINALKIVGKKKENLEISCIGSGAAMAATIRLLRAWGIKGAQIRLVDSQGTVDRSRKDIPAKTEKGRLKGLVQQLKIIGPEASKQAAIKGADIVIAASVSVPGGVIKPAWLKTMRPGAIVFAVANPYPEVDYDSAKKAGVSIVATGRSDFPNQVNNSLGFPGIFRGVLDVRAKTITDRMALAAAEGLAERGQALKGFGPEKIVPQMDDLEMVLAIALATARQATKEGLAEKPLAKEKEFLKKTKNKLLLARKMNQALIKALF